MFYTTGEDRVFPKGLPVGRVVSQKAGPTFKLIDVVPAANSDLDEVLIVLEGVHQEIPQPNSVAERIQLSPAPQPGKDSSANLVNGAAAIGQLVTDADKTVEQYRVLERQRGATFGAFGSQVPSFSGITSQPVRQPDGILPQDQASPTPATQPVKPSAQAPTPPPKSQNN